MRGGCLIALGAGLLLGQWISSEFLCIILGLIFAVFGFCFLRQK